MCDKKFEVGRKNEGLIPSLLFQCDFLQGVIIGGVAEVNNKDSYSLFTPFLFHTVFNDNLQFLTKERLYALKNTMKTKRGN